MTFDPNADISGGRVSSGGRGRGTAMAVGGGGIGMVALILVSAFLGVDVTGLLGGAGVTGGTSQLAPDEAGTAALEQCRTGADANEKVECRMKGASASLEAYWETEAPKIGVSYHAPSDFRLFSGSTSTGCGGATSASGPFYCPPDQTIYLDVDFFDELRSQFGSSGGPLAEMYVIAHEWGHHIQNLAGILERTQDGQTGATSNSVRTELQADCFAGAWAGAASTTKDSNGTTFLTPITEAQIQDALSAASAVGDDRIQSRMQGQVQPHTFTHGTSEQRMRWFSTGFKQGAQVCDTFTVSGGAL